MAGKNESENGNIGNDEEVAPPPLAENAIEFGNLSLESMVDESERKLTDSDFSKELTDKAEQIEQIFNIDNNEANQYLMRPNRGRQPWQIPEKV